MIEKSKIFYLPIITFFFISFTAIILYLINLDKTAKLKILISPSSARITINQTLFQNGEHRFKPGTYQVLIEHPDFTTHQTTIELQANLENYLYLALEPHNPNWYENHPKEASILQTISDRQAIVEYQSYVGNNPIFKITPFYNYDQGFDISTSKNSSGEVLINIYLYTCNPSEVSILQQNALSWLKQQKISSSDYPINYTYCDQKTATPPLPHS